MTDVEHPPLGPVTRLVAELEAREVDVAVGGSAVLASVGIIDRINDWDVTTDADPLLVSDAIAAAGLAVIDSTGTSEVFATRQRLIVDAGDHSIDLLNGFAAWDSGNRVEFPVRVAWRWNGLPIADPHVWVLAYRTIGRPERAELLEGWLAQRSLLG